MCYVTATELKQNLSFYLEKSMSEDVLVTKNGKVISALVNPDDRAYEEFMKLKGCLKGAIPDDMDYKDALNERVEKKCGF